MSRARTVIEEMRARVERLQIKRDTKGVEIVDGEFGSDHSDPGVEDDAADGKLGRAVGEVIVWEEDENEEFEMLSVVAEESEESE